MEIHTPNGPQVRMGYVINTVPTWGQYSKTSGRYLPFQDSLLTGFIYKLEARSFIPRGVSDFIPGLNIPSLTTQVYEGYKPAKTGRIPYNGRVGEFISHALSLFTGQWEEFYPKAVKGDMEKGTYHVNLKGSCLRRHPWTVIRNTVSGLTQYVGGSVSAIFPQSLRFVGTIDNFSILPIGTGGSVGGRCHLDAVTNNLRNYSATFYGSTWSRKYSDISVSVGTNGAFDIGYTITNGSAVGTGWLTSTHRVTVKSPGEATSQLVGSFGPSGQYDQTWPTSICTNFRYTVNIVSMEEKRVDMYGNVIHHYVGPVEQFSSEYVAVATPWSYQTTPVVSFEFDYEWLIPTGHDSPKYGATQRFTTAITSYDQDLGLTAWWAQQQALEKMIYQASADWVETLKELMVLSPYIDVYRLMKAAIIGTRNWRKKPGEAVKSLLDAFSGTTLFWYFGAKPTIEAFVELNEIMGPTYESLRNAANKKYISYGSWQGKLPTNLIPDFPDVDLFTRCKLQARVTDNTILLALLGAKGVGLLPTLEQLWAYMPMSFLIEDSTGIGAGLRSVDTSVMGVLGFDIEWVNTSLHASYDLTPVLDMYGIEPIRIQEKTPRLQGRDYPLISFYRRWTNTLSPIPSWSNLDFSNPRNSPPVLTTGSLAYSIAFSDDLSTVVPERRNRVKEDILRWAAKHKIPKRNGVDI